MDIKVNFPPLNRYLLPDYLRGKLQLIGTVTFTVLFSLVFMLISIPFSHNAWFELGASQAFSFTALFFILSVVIVIVSKRIMYATRTSLRMTYLQYVLWNLGEMVIICILYTSFSIQGDAMGIIHLEETTVMRFFLKSMSYIFVSMCIPYIIAGMFFAIDDKNRTICLMSSDANTVTDEHAENGSSGKKVTLYSDSGVMKLSVSLSNLYFIESDDNYIIVRYSDSKGELKKYMLRCRLKSVEESFRDSSLVRCHRKYIVNMDKVKVLRKTRDGYELDLDNDTIPPIPVTKTYAENVLGRFNSCNQK